MTDQRQRFVFSWIAEPKVFGRDQPLLSHLFNHWKASGVTTVGSGRPVDATIAGDANQDGNGDNDRLPGAQRNSFDGPEYATTDLRLTRRLLAHDRWKLELIGESFNLLNRDNRRFRLTSDGLVSNSAQFVQDTKHIGDRYFPAFYQIPTNFMRVNGAFAPRQLQLALRLSY